MSKTIRIVPIMAPVDYAPTVILVVSASTHPEPQHMAAGLAAAGHDVMLATSASFTPSEWPMRLARRLPQGRAQAEILRRELPSALSGSQVMRGGYRPELGYLWHTRLRHNPAAAWPHIMQRASRLQDKVERWISTNRPEVVIAQQESAARPFAAVGDSAFKILSYPIAHHRWLADVLTAETEDNPEWAQFINAADIPDAERMAMLDEEIELADHLVVGSTFVQRTCVEHGVDPERITVLPLAAPPFGTSTDDSPVFSPDAPLKVLFAGQLTQRKGMSYLRDAWARLDRPGAELALIGMHSAEMRRRFEGLPGVSVHAPIPRASLMAAQASADVLVLPSLGEGFPLVCIEAMSVGTAVIISEATFAHDVVTDGVDGYVVPMRDSDAIVEHLRELADTPGLADRMGSAARERATDLTWARYEERAAESLDALISGRTAP